MEGYSIGIIKPDAIHHCHEILQIIEKRGLKVIFQKEVHLDKQSLINIYKEHAHKNFFQSVYNFMVSGNCLAFIAKGNNAIKDLNEIVGATDPCKAKPGTLRSQFGTSIIQNAIHCSDNKKHFKRELKLLFPELVIEKPFTTRDKSSGFLFYTMSQII